MQQNGLGHRFLDLMFWIVGAGSLLGAVWFFRASQAPQAKKSTANRGGFRFNVKTIAVTRTKITESIRLVGDIVPLRQVTLHSEVEGTLVKVGAREGQSLRPGGVLAYLQRGDLVLQVKKQEALLQQARASAQRMKATFQRDRDLWLRANRLYQTRHVSEREWIEARYQKEASQFALAENVALIALREAELKMAQRDLARTMIRAPFASTVKRLLVEQGRLLRKGDPVAELVSKDGVEIRLLIPPSVLPQIREKMQVWLQVGNIQQEETLSHASTQGWLKANIGQLAPVTDTTSRNRQAILRLKNTPASFVPGLPVVARVVVQERDQALVIPKDALIRTGMDWIVFRVQDEKAQRVPVQVVVEEGSRVAVQGGLSEGDPIVYVGNEALFPSAPVQVVAGPGSQKK